MPECLERGFGIYIHVRINDNCFRKHRNRGMVKIDSRLRGTGSRSSVRYHGCVLLAVVSYNPGRRLYKAGHNDQGCYQHPKSGSPTRNYNDCLLVITKYHGLSCALSHFSPPPACYLKGSEYPRTRSWKTKPVM